MTKHILCTGSAYGTPIGEFIRHSLAFSADGSSIALLFGGTVIGTTDASYLRDLDDGFASASSDSMTDQSQAMIEKSVESMSRFIDSGDIYHAIIAATWLSTARSNLDPTNVGDHEDTVRSIEYMMAQLHQEDMCRRMVAATAFVVTHDVFAGVVSEGGGYDCPVADHVLHTIID